MVTKGSFVDDDTKFQFMVALLDINDGEVEGSFCGGILIASDIVMTAAHCFTQNRRLFNLCQNGKYGCTKVSMGSKYSVALDEHRIVIEVADIFIHENYDFHRAFYVHDIALLKLDKPAPISDYIQIATLPNKTASGLENEGIILGWGASSNKGQSLIGLKEASVKLLDHSICNDMIDDEGIKLTATNICSIGQNDTADGSSSSCHGDSGGAVVDSVDQTIVGIISGSDDCNSSKKFKYVTFSYDFATNFNRHTCSSCQHSTLLGLAE